MFGRCESQRRRRSTGCAPCFSCRPALACRAHTQTQTHTHTHTKKKKNRTHTDKHEYNTLILAKCMIASRLRMLPRNAKLQMLRWARSSNVFDLWLVRRWVDEQSEDSLWLEVEDFNISYLWYSGGNPPSCSFSCRLQKVCRLIKTTSNRAVRNTLGRQANTVSTLPI